MADGARRNAAGAVADGARRNAAGAVNEHAAALVPLRRPPPLQAVVAGSGPPLVVLHAFALSPVAYQRTIDVLSADHRVVVPWWLWVPERTWDADDVTERLVRLIDEVADGRATLLGHSFGGALALYCAVRYPDRVAALVLADALTAPSRRDLARLGLPGRHLVPLVSAPGARAFLGTVTTRPRNIARAGWWGFTADVDGWASELRGSRLRRAVLWARDDSMLPLAWGQRLAALLDAPLVVVEDPDGGRLDHDWVFRRPELLRGALAEL